MYKHQQFVGKGVKQLRAEKEAILDQVCVCVCVCVCGSGSVGDRRQMGVAGQTKLKASTRTKPTIRISTRTKPLILVSR